MSRNPDRETVFHFKRFDVVNRQSAMKVGTDGVLLGAWAGMAASGGRVLDVGCGTGLIALMLAQRGATHVVGVEIDEQAAQEALSNAQASPWPEVVSIVHSDFAAFSAQGQRFDLIVSNPPFFSGGALAPEGARRTARHALSLSYNSILARAGELLSPGGRIALILPADQEADVIFSAVVCHLQPLRICRVSTKPGAPPSRLLIEFGFAPGLPAETDLLELRTVDGAYSQKYVNLTADFYLNF